MITTAAITIVLVSTGTVIMIVRVGIGGGRAAGGGECANASGETCELYKRDVRIIALELAQKALDRRMARLDVIVS